MIETDRLLLRPLEPNDADWITEGISDPCVLRWLTSPPAPYVREDAVDFLAEHGASSDHLAICADRPVGVISLGAASDGTASLGFWLARAAWGQGMMTEAARARLAWHFARSGGPVLSGWVEGNAASARIHAKLGFTPTGHGSRNSNVHRGLVTVVEVRLDPPARPPS